VLEHYRVEAKLPEVGVWLLVPRKSRTEAESDHVYRLRAADMLHPLGLIVVIGCSWLGGLLLERHAFRLKPDERLLAGAGIGMATFVGLANLLGALVAGGVRFLGSRPAGFARWAGRGCTGG